MNHIIAEEYAADIERRASLKKRFARELGFVVGTDADPTLWALNFGCSPVGATAIIEQLKRERRCVERDGKLYRF